MTFFNAIFSFLTIVVNLYALLKVYSRISNVKLEFNKRNNLIFTVAATLVFIINYYLVFSSKLVLVMISVYITYRLIFKEPIYKTLYRLIIIYLVLMFCDFLVSTIFLIFPINSVLEIGNITLIKGISTLLVSILLQLFFLPRILRIGIMKIEKFLLQKSNLLFISFVFVLFLLYMFLTYLNAVEFTFKVFIICMCILITFMCFFVVVLIQYFKNVRVEKEQESLLNLISEYEKMLEKDRVNRHEMLNNLVILKSATKKNKKEFEDMLDEIIAEYQYKKSGLYSKLYNMPSGIKGVIYYRLAGNQLENFDFNLLMSVKAKKKLEEIKPKEYYKVCKILGILLDNALEAALETKEKLILIDIYTEGNDLFIYIENTFNKKMDIKKFCEKGVSSKGEDRGYGLFIISKLIKKNKELSFVQKEENNKIVSILKVTIV